MSYANEIGLKRLQDKQLVRFRVLFQLSCASLWFGSLLALLHYTSFGFFSMLYLLGSLTAVTTHLAFIGFAIGHPDIPLFDGKNLGGL